MANQDLSCLCISTQILYVRIIQLVKIYEIKSKFPFKVLLVTLLIPLIPF